MLASEPPDGKTPVIISDVQNIAGFVDRRITPKVGDRLDDGGAHVGIELGALLDGGGGVVGAEYAPRRAP